MAPANIPTTADVLEYADRLSIEVSEADAEAFAEQFSQQDEVLAALETVAGNEPPSRDYWEPDPDDDQLGAWLTRCDIADAGATGPLDELTVGVKDNIAVAGVPMTCGSPILADREYLPPRDATVVARLLSAGARVVGKTNMDEFAFGGSRSTMRLRLARNPKNPDHQPGSSSAGSAVAVAAGDVDLAVGSDTGGSIRFPAAWSGVPGLKPTRGLVSHDGFVQFAKTLDSVGFLAGSVETLARGLDAVAGADARDERTTGASTDDYAETAVDALEGDPSGLTIGMPEELYGAAPELDEAVRDALDQLADAGAELREVSIEAYDLWLPAWLGIAMTEVGNYLRANATNYWALSPGIPSLTAAIHEATADRTGDLGDPLLAGILYAEHRNSVDGDRMYVLAQRARRRLAEGVDAALENVDVLASTTVPMLAPKWDDDIDDVFGALAHTGPFNVTGHPAISVPCGEIDGLPVGLQFIAGRFEDATAIQTASYWRSVNQTRE